MANEQIHAEIMAALGELKALADGVDTLKARLLVLTAMVAVGPFVGAC